MRGTWVIAPSGIGLLTIMGLTMAASSATYIAPSADQIIAARQAALDLSVMDMAEMKKAAKDGSDIKKQAYPADALARWAKVLPTLFPAGTGPGETSLQTHAKPAIWSQRAEFEKDAAAYLEAVQKLGQIARSSDAAALGDQLQAVAKTCDACHDTFKSK